MSLVAWVTGIGAAIWAGINVFGGRAASASYSPSTSAPPQPPEPIVNRDTIKSVENTVAATSEIATSLEAGGVAGARARVAERARRLASASAEQVAAPVTEIFTVPVAVGSVFLADKLIGAAVDKDKLKHDQEDFKQFVEDVSNKPSKIVTVPVMWAGNQVIGVFNIARDLSLSTADGLLLLYKAKILGSKKAKEEYLPSSMHKSLNDMKSDDGVVIQAGKYIYKTKENADKRTLVENAKHLGEEMLDSASNIGKYVKDVASADAYILDSMNEASGLKGIGGALGGLIFDVTHDTSNITSPSIIKKTGAHK